MAEETIEEEIETVTETKEPKELTTEEIVAKFGEVYENEGDELSEEEKAKAEEDKEAEVKKGKSEGDDDAVTKTSEDEKPKKKLSRNAKKQSRLLKQVDEAKGETAEVIKKLQAAEADKELYKKALAELKGDPNELKKPDPNDFEYGEEDEKFIQAKQVYDDKILDKKVSEKLQKATQQQSQQLSQAKQAENLKKRQDEHWAKVDKDGPEDYSVKETALVDVIGVDMVNHIIENCPEDSDKVVYYLGANEEEARELATMLSNRNSMIRGVLKLGRIQAKLASPDNNKPKPAANPDEEIEGGEKKRFRKRGPSGAKFY